MKWLERGFFKWFALASWGMAFFMGNIYCMCSQYQEKAPEGVKKLRRF